MGRPLGQHFLRDKGIVSAMLKAAHLLPQEHVVEIGPGKGIMTEALACRVQKVTAVELDKKLLPYLNALRVSHPNIHIVHQDILKFTPPSNPYTVIGSIPYYITSPILNHFLYEQVIQGGRMPEKMVLLMQKEVAEKICDKKSSVLGLHVHAFGEPSIIRTVSRNVFTPPPKVESAILKIDIAKTPKIQGDLGLLFRFIHAGFAHKRKTLENNFRAAFGKEKTQKLLEKTKIDGKRRAETLTLEEWSSFLH